MRRFLVPFIRPDSFVHTRSSAGFTITTTEFEFSVHIGTTKLHRLEENLGAANIGLTGHDLAEIGRAASAITVQGARYPEWLEATTGR
jgi:hypothetical protein